ncbi:hypothetical protein KSP40_PGU019723 [Platanthera guangdongensis]|uniref:Uncharacterized protein n=1 Tax=Platanthera guangdongensis TaxID=2320717 RepID=A0ABR2LQW1_9ASPA
MELRPPSVPLISRCRLTTMIITVILLVRNFTAVVSGDADGYAFSVATVNPTASQTVELLLPGRLKGQPKGSLNKQNDRACSVWNRGGRMNLVHLTLIPEVHYDEICVLKVFKPTQFYHYSYNVSRASTGYTKSTTTIPIWGSSIATTLHRGRINRWSPERSRAQPSKRKPLMGRHPHRQWRYFTCQTQGVGGVPWWMARAVVRRWTTAKIHIYFQKGLIKGSCMGLIEGGPVSKEARGTSHDSCSYLPDDMLKHASQADNRWQERKRIRFSSSKPMCQAFDPQAKEGHDLVVGLLSGESVDRSSHASSPLRKLLALRSDSKHSISARLLQRTSGASLTKLSRLAESEEEEEEVLNKEWG